MVLLDASCGLGPPEQRAWLVMDASLSFVFYLLKQCLGRRSVVCASEESSVLPTYSDYPRTRCVRNATCHADVCSLGRRSIVDSGKGVLKERVSSHTHRVRVRLLAFLFFCGNFVFFFGGRHICLVSVVVSVVHRHIPKMLLPRLLLASGLSRSCVRVTLSRLDTLGEAADNAGESESAAWGKKTGHTAVPFFWDVPFFWEVPFWVAPFWAVPKYGGNF